MIFTFNWLKLIQWTFQSDDLANTGKNNGLFRKIPSTNTIDFIINKSLSGFHLARQNLTLSHLGDLIHSQRGGGADSAPPVTLLSLLHIKPNLVW